MRRITLALSFSLLLTTGLSAAAQQVPPSQQVQTPPPSRPPVVAPASTPSTHPPPGVPSIAAQGQQGSRPGTTPPRDITAVFGQTGSVQNVQLVIKISDSLSSEVQTTKNVTMLVADYQSGQIRSSGSGSEGLINIDARPQLQRDGRIRLQLTVEYRPDLMSEQYEQLVKRGAVRILTLSESLTVLLADGKPTVVSQSSDPRSDRKVSLEVTATILR